MNGINFELFEFFVVAEGEDVGFGCLLVGEDIILRGAGFDFDTDFDGSALDHDNIILNKIKGWIPDPTTTSTDGQG